MNCINPMNKILQRNIYHPIPYNLSFMLKWTLIFSLLFFISSSSFAQQNNIEIKGTSNKHYVEHTIAPKENFYSIGRMYNVPAKDIAAYNTLQLEGGLSIGQIIKVPLNENNFSQTASAKPGEILVPVYHSVEPKEGLYRVSVNYNKVPLDDLKKWNHLQSDEVSAGQALIIGYLKVDKNESPLASAGISGTPAQVLAKVDDKVQLKWIMQAYKLFPDKENFFLKTSHFNLIAGNDLLMQQIKDGLTEDEIRKTWEPGLSNFKKIRKKYLLYKDFE